MYSMYLVLGTALPKGGKPAEEKDHNKHEHDMKRNSLTRVYKYTKKKEEIACSPYP